MVLVDAVWSALGETGGGAGGAAASRSGVVDGVAAGADASIAAGAGEVVFELVGAVDGAGAAGTGATSAASTTDANAAASLDAGSELSLSPSWSLLSLPAFAGALADCFGCAEASDDEASSEALEELPELPLCDEFDEAELAWFCAGWFCAWFCAGWFFEGAAEAGWVGVCGCCAVEFCWLELFEEFAGGAALGVGGAGALLTLDCRTLEKLCVGALLPLAGGEAGAAGAALIMSRIENVIKQAAYAQAR